MKQGELFFLLAAGGILAIAALSCVLDFLTPIKKAPELRFQAYSTEVSK